MAKQVLGVIHHKSGINIQCFSRQGFLKRRFQQDIGLTKECKQIGDASTNVSQIADKYIVHFTANTTCQPARKHAVAAD